jgi:hypothetical protein
MTRIVLHIDRLVLRGMAPAEVETLTAALTQELERQLARPHMAQTLSRMGHRARIKLGEVHSPAFAAEGLGQAVAQRIIHGLHPR